MNEKEAIALIRRGYEEAWNQGRLDVIDQILHAEFVAHDPAAPAPVRGREAVAATLRGIRAAFPDIRRVAEDWVGGENKIAVRWMITGTHLGPFNGLAPTGKVVRVTGITLYRIQDGQVAEEWVQMDALGLMRQLGQG